MTGEPDFASIKQINMYGEEYWSARDLMPLLGYSKKWQNFESVIKKAMSACEESGFRVQDHFTDASKGIAGGKGSIQHVKDYYLSKYACYLVAMNGDPRKSPIALAQTYFAVSTHAYEMHQIREEQVTGLDNAMHTHYFVGNEVRKAIEAVHRPMPEDLPPAPSIRKMVEERRRSHRKPVRGKEQQGQDDQETLF